MAKVVEKKRAASSKSPKKSGRAKAVKSSKKKATVKKTAAGKTGNSGTKTAARRKKGKADTNKSSGKVTMRKQQTLVENSGADSGAGIPQFDLNEQMLAERRRSTSKRRKGPKGKEETPEPAVQDTPGRQIMQAAPESSEKRHIIEEIVRRDIEKLRRNR